MSGTLEHWDNQFVTSPTVRVLTGIYETELGADIRIVPAASVVISVAGARSKTIRLDGVPTRLSASGLVSVDLTRSTGFHRVEVDGESIFWFGTEDAKLGLKGLEAMLNDLSTMGTGWTGQALFSDGTGLRDPHVLFGWLDAWADKGLNAAEGILVSPRTAMRSTKVLRRRGGAGVLLAPTIRLLRSDPRRNLTESATGALQVSGISYEPLRVVSRSRETTLDTIANRRAVGLVSWIERLAREVLASAPDAIAATRCRAWSSRARALQRRPLAMALRASSPAGAPRQPEEATEQSYRLSYDISRDLSARFGWSATVKPMPRLSYVGKSDAIYQAYVASCLAGALGLSQTSDVLGQKQPAFSGPRFDIYYDTPPPVTVLRSWRSSSDRPDRSRPDVLLHERETGRVAVLDAKYRIGGDGAASEDSRKDVTAYMGLYGLADVTIIFPGIQGTPNVINGHGRRIIELPIAPPARNIGESLPIVLSTLAHPVF